MALSKIKTASLAADSVDNTILDLADDYTLTGNVLLPAAPRFKATMSASFTATHNATNVVRFNYAMYDTASAFDTVNYRYTPNKEGWWLFNYQVMAQSLSGGTHYFMNGYLRKNGPTVLQNVRGKSTSSTGSDEYLGYSYIEYANGTTDWFDVAWYHYDYSSSAGVTIYASNNSTLFQGIWLGAN